jgi:hypothetical protein
MPEKTGCTFVPKGNASLPESMKLRSVEAVKPSVVFLAHQDVILGHVLQQRCLEEHIRVVPLVRSSGVHNAVSRDEVEKNLGGASLLVLAPCRHSMFENTDAFTVEKRAVELAHAHKMWIALLIHERACCYPSYMEEVRAYVMLTISLDEQDSVLRQRYLLANHLNLHEIPVATRTGHSFHDNQQKQVQFPSNVAKLGHRLKCLGEQRPK